MGEPNESPEAMFQRTLKMEASVARVLIAGGIATLEELAYVPIGELLEVQGLDESLAQQFRKRARAYLLRDVMGDEGEGEAVDA